MERLTVRAPNGKACYANPTSDPAGWAKNRTSVLGRLADYEDIGLMPEQVAELKANNEMPGEAVEIVIAPGIKPGDLLYEVDQASDEPIVCEVLYIQYIEGFKCRAKENGIASAWNIHVQVIEGHGKDSCYSFELSDLEKTVFKTEEEARAALGKDA